MKRFLVITLLFSIALPPRFLARQAPSSPASALASVQVRALLESSDSRGKAWGAFLAAQGKMRELEPQLRKNLEAHLNPRTLQEQLILDTTLDAFIQFGSDSLPFDLLQSIYSRKPEPALILLAAPNRPKPQVDEFLLKVLNEESGRPGLKWFAAADLLLNHRAPGFVAAILRDLKISGRVLICDSARNCVRKDSPGGIAGSIFGSLLEPGYPPWPNYLLVKPNMASPLPPVHFIRGPDFSTSMAYIRYLEGDGGHSGCPLCGFSALTTAPTTKDRMTYIAAAAGPNLRTPIKDDERLEIQWRNRQDYRAKVAQFRENITQRYSTMIGELRNAGLLTAEEAAMLAVPTVEIVVDDLRNNKTPL
jgi:hypothetical protein